MLYTEMCELTKERCTYEEFEKIDAIYMDCESMTKQEAARIWNRTYGVEYKKREAIRRDMEAQLLSSADTDFIDRSEKVRTAIYEASELLRGLGMYTDNNGVRWSKCECGKTPNRCHTVYDLGIMVNGKFKPVGHRYY